MKSTLLLGALIALFAVPTLAGAVTARHEPEEPGCFGKGKEAKVESAQGKIAEGKVRAGINALRMQGELGCSALVDWLAGGAAGGNEDQVEDVIAWVGRSDVPGALEQVLAHADDEREDVRDMAVFVLEERLVELTAAEAEALIGATHEDTRETAVGILAGHHSIGAIEMVKPAVVVGPSIPMWVEQEFYGALELPAAHAAALGHLVSDPEADVREHCAVVMGRMLYERLASSPAYGEHLLTLVSDEDEDVAEAAAKGAGYGTPANGPAIVDAVVARAADEGVEELMDGLDECVDEGTPTEHTLAMLQYIATSGPESERNAAEKMAKKCEKKLKKQK
jgi:hypothetical protein